MKNNLLTVWILLIGLGFCSSFSTYAQCAGGAYWVNGANAGGSLRDTGVIALTDTVYVRSTNPTFGSFTSMRPGYGINGSTWNGMTFQSLLQYRGGGSGATTAFKLKIPLDSFNIHFKVSDVRGDFANRENQRILGFNAGVPVPASFKDFTMGGSNSGNDFIGGGSTNGTNQSSARIFFNAPVDSVVIISISGSDYVIMELMVRCDLVLAQPSLNLQGTASNHIVQLNWEAAQPGNYTLLQSNNARNWLPVYETEKKQVGKEKFQFQQIATAEGNTYYKLKYSSAQTYPLYSNIKVFYIKPSTHPITLNNPFENYLKITAVLPIIQFTLSDMHGRKIKNYIPSPINSGAIHLSTAALQKGHYVLSVSLKDGSHYQRLVTKQ